MIATLHSVVFDAADFDGLATFYADLLGATRDYADPDWIGITTPDGWRLNFQLAPDHIAAHWPGQAHPQQAHLDVIVPDLAVAAARAIGLGATPLRANDTYHTLADPAGHPFDLCERPSNAGVTIMGLMLDCPDAAALSEFYAAVLGLPITYAAEGAAMVGAEGDHPLLFQQVSDYAAPRWPDPAFPQQLHLDLDVTDIAVAEPAVLELGARRLGDGGQRFRVFADPAGKPFCLCWK